MNKIILSLIMVCFLMGSCRKNEIPCYACQWVKSGKIQPGTEQRCGLDVQDWAMRVRVEQPNFYPVCARK